MEWYRCTDKAEAQKMLDDINALPIFPRVGRNALTKEPEPTKQQTLCWREEVIEGKDGSFGFPVLTKDDMGRLNVPRKEESSVPIFEDKYKNEIPVSNVWEIATDSNRGKNHIAPFPVKLPETAIKCYSNKDKNIIYEPFAGGGTTLIACEQTNRICYGMELDPIYIDVILRRYHNLYPDKEIKCLNRKFNFKELWQNN